MKEQFCIADEWSISYTELIEYDLGRSLFQGFLNIYDIRNESLTL